VVHGAAMRNERMAARQRLADAYRAQLSASQARLQQRWKETAAELEKLTTTTPAPAAFAKCVQSGLVNAVVIFDDTGRISYPDGPLAEGGDPGVLEAKWNEAGRLENLHKFNEAANQYGALARAATNANLAARAIQSEARCRMQAGKPRRSSGSSRRPSAMTGTVVRPIRKGGSSLRTLS